MFVITGAYKADESRRINIWIELLQQTTIHHLIYMHSIFPEVSEDSALLSTGSTVGKTKLSWKTIVLRILNFLIVFIILGVAIAGRFLVFWWFF